MTTFDVGIFGLQDPEGIVYDPFWNTFVVADRRKRDLYEFTAGIDLLRRINLNLPGSKPSGVTIAPSSINPALRSYWVTDRRVDNQTDPLENDGRIYEIVAIPLGGNAAPIVDAGPPQTLSWPANTASLSGFVNDDGHPYPPSLVLSLWTVLSGPGSVTFGDAASPSTTATFSAPGKYVLQLVGDDSELDTADTVTITARRPGGGGCGIGPELAAFVPLLAWLHRRRRRA